MNSIALIGFMGAGKSAVGRELASRTGLPRHDTDEMIRQRFARSIPEIFAQHGEEAFREAETEALRKVSGPAVLVTGGGIVLRPENVKLLRARGRVIWLDGKEDVLWQRATLRSTRPLLHSENPRQKFSEMFLARLPLYQAASDHRVDTSELNVIETADAVLAIL